MDLADRLQALAQHHADLMQEADAIFAGAAAALAHAEALCAALDQGTRPSPPLGGFVPGPHGAEVELG